MAKTIAQMAEDYAYTNWECEDYHEGAEEELPFDPISHTEKSYLAGASAVLSEIESIMLKTHCVNPNEVIDIIASRNK